MEPVFEHLGSQKVSTLKRKAPVGQVRQQTLFPCPSLGNSTAGSGEEGKKEWRNTAFLSTPLMIPKPQVQPELRGRKVRDAWNWVCSKIFCVCFYQLIILGFIIYFGFFFKFFLRPLHFFSRLHLLFIQNKSPSPNS